MGNRLTILIISLNSIMALSLYDIAKAEGPDDPTTTPAPSKAKPTNFTRTSDPNVVIGKHGAPITRAEFELANKNGQGWTDFDSYADYVGGWAHPINPDQVKTEPYYRTYAGKNIPGSDIAILKMQNDPAINKILDRNIAGSNEVPQFGVEDSDTIRALIASAKNPYGIQQIATTKK